MTAPPPVIDLSNGSRLSFAYLRRVREAGVDACGVAILHKGTPEALSAALARWRRRLQAHPDFLFAAVKASELHSRQRRDKLALLLTLGNADAFAGNPALVARAASRGLKMVQLTGNDQGSGGSGCGAEDTGLSAVGRTLVEAMNAAGLVVDLAHASPRTIEEAVAVSTAPVVVSHTAARALCDHPRNVSDRTMQRVSEHGGLIGICPFPAFLRQDRAPILEDLFRHLDHALEVAGPKHVALTSDMIEGKRASDFHGLLGTAHLYPEWPWRFPEGFRTIVDLPQVTAMLHDRYAGPIVRGLLGGNALRVLGEVDTVARTSLSS